MKKTYQDLLQQHLAEYRVQVLGIRESGTFRYHGRDIPKPHLLPPSLRMLNLLPAALPFVNAYRAEYKSIEGKAFKLHRYFHHLNSSQAFAFNLFFPFFYESAEASGALLSALGLPGQLAWWEPESVPDEEEGTNLDAYWELTDGSSVFCEVKLSEAEFGVAKCDEAHKAKIAALYRPMLSGYVRAPMLEDQAFCDAYQILRNVWHLLRRPRSNLVFLMPLRNWHLWNRLTAVLAQVEPHTRQRISIVAIEEVLEKLGAPGGCPVTLAEHVRGMKLKYLPPHHPDVINYDRSLPPLSFPWIKPPYPKPPKPGTPEFLALIEHHKDVIEQMDGVRPEFILDIGVGDMPTPTEERRKKPEL